jgi:hypothetical protein
MEIRENISFILRGTYAQSFRSIAPAVTKHALPDPDEF